jgi:hypothetical protein
MAAMTRWVMLVLLSSAVAHAGPATRLGKPKATRGENYIVNFELPSVVPNPDAVGVGGITKLDGLDFEGCKDAPSGPPSDWQGREVDGGNGLVVRVTDVATAGKSKRGWPGTRCGFRIVDRADPRKYADIPSDRVPPFNSPTGILRDGDHVFVNLNFNGYASEVDGKGNLVVALDLGAHSELWRSANMVSNGSMMMVNELLVTGYGFTSEKHFLIALDAGSGRVAQKIDLPKTPAELARKGSTLYVRIYDGYVEIPITGATGK